MVLFPLFTTLRAQTLSLEFLLGFNGVFRLGNWTPLSVTLENKGRGFQGRLEVETASGSEYRNDIRRRTYAAVVDLPQGSRKTFPFTIYIDSFSHPLFIRLTQGDRVLFRQSVNLRNHFVEKPLLLFAGANPGDLQTLTAETYHPVASPLTTLPHCWYGYLGLTALILEADALASLAAGQYAAMTEWLRAGGHLILIGSPSSGGPLPERAKILFPLEILGLERKTRLASLERLGGVPLSSSEPFLLSRTYAPQASIRIREGDAPLILEKKIGLGTILFLTFDPLQRPFRHWPGRTAFWDYLSNQGSKSSEIPPPLLEDRIFSSMITHLPGRFPTFWVSLLLVGLYLSGITLTIKKFGEKDRKGKGLLAGLALMICCGSLASGLLGYWTQIRYRLASNGFLLIQNQGSDGPSRWTYHWGVYSQQDRIYRLPLDRGTQPAASFPNANPNVIRFQSFTLEDAGGAWVLTFPLQRWTHRFFTFTSYHPPFLRARATWVAKNLFFFAVNQGSVPLRDCQIHFGGRTLPLPSIPAGQSVWRSWTVDPAFFPEGTAQLPANHQAVGAVAKTASPLRKELQRHLIPELQRALAERYRGDADRIFLLGWTDDWVFSPAAGRPLPVANGAGLLLGEIPVERTERPPFSGETRIVK